MPLHSTICDEKVWLLYPFAASLATLLLLSLQRVPSALSTIQKSPMRLLLLIELSRLSFLSCVDSIDAAPPPHVLLAGVLHTALLPLTGDYSLSLLSCVPPSGNRPCVTELGPSLGKAWSSSYVSLARPACGLSYGHPYH
ncbi:uncharacterized protein UDID_18388 [Ustilago sp. UG-2017a]|nr:uncharacterized protein UDID_18388 [Ustilago sp. UG-2017a]